VCLTEAERIGWDQHVVDFYYKSSPLRPTARIVFIGMHFFDLVPLMALLELIRGPLNIKTREISSADPSSTILQGLLSDLDGSHRQNRSFPRARRAPRWQKMPACLVRWQRQC
jgi:hypothetical protein